MLLKSVLGVLFGMAMIAAAARTALRLKQHGRLFFDDLFLLIACIFLTAATIITYHVSWALYVPYSDFTLFHPNDLKRRVIWFQKMVFAYISLTWVVIFAVKLSFMYFFRALVDRLVNMVIYWRIVLGVIVVSFAVCVSEAAMECPHFDISSGMSPIFSYFFGHISKHLTDIKSGIVHCVLGPGVNRTMGVMTATICLDFITDLMSSISLPPL